jgi:hypothetical protein
LLILHWWSRELFLCCSYTGINSPNFNPSDNLIHILVLNTTWFHNQEDIALSDMRRVCYKRNFNICYLFGLYGDLISLKKKYSLYFINH